MLRIITGHLRGRKLIVPPAYVTRPTSDRVRESIFNLLESFFFKKGYDFSHITVLDAFAGSGALGFEALSRGAKHVTFFEKDPQAFKILKQNAALLALEPEKFDILRTSVLSPPVTSQERYLIFLDPPYRQKLWEPSYKSLKQKGWIGPHSLIVYECDKREDIPESPNFFWEIDRIYGNTRILIGYLAAEERKTSF